MRANNLFPNIMECSTRLRDTMNDYNETFRNFNDPNITAKREDYVFNFTRVLSDSTADAAADCFLTYASILDFIDE